jgi:diguanylate cyclase (GGDEF)-like protein
VWLGLAAALALAVVAGAAALWSAARVRRSARRVTALQRVALTDPLTGLLNRRGFDQMAERELARARRYGRPFAVAYLDVRGLKQVNDSAGHAAGDRLLRQVAAMMRSTARADDAVARLGGDELAMLLVEQDGAGAAAVSQRIRRQVPDHRHRLGVPVAWDVTIGTATFPADGTTVDELLRAADQRLYRQRGIAVR